MKTQPVRASIPNLRVLLCMAALLGMARWSEAAGTTTWSGAGTTMNWSTAGNWTTAGGSTPPAASDAVVFGGGAFPASTNTLAAIDNVVSASTSIASLVYTNATGIYHTTQLAAGQTLTVNGNVFVGFDNTTTIVNMVGTGNFTVVGGANSVFGVGANTNAPYTQTSESATLVLADGNNTITTATNMICRAVSNNTKPCTLSLGNGINVLNSDTFIIGSGKDRGTLNFAAAGAGTLKMRARDGVSRANLYMAIDGGGSASGKATVSLNGHAVDLLFNGVTIGSGSSGGGIKDATLQFDTGTMDVNNLLIAIKGGSGGLFNYATNTVGSAGVLNVNTSFAMCSGTSSTKATTNNAALNINGGTVHAFCDITKGPASQGAVDTATITMSGGTLDIQGHNIGTASIGVDNLILNGSALSNLTAVTGSSIPIFVTNLNVTGANLISVKTLPTVLSYPMTFHLIAYSSESGGGTWSTPNLPGGYTGSISDSGTTIDVIVTGGPTVSKSDTWNGNVNGNWDTNTLNWLSGGAAKYVQGDVVTLDDSLTGTANVNLTTNLNPGGVTVSNAVANYVFSGSGSIGGIAALVKTGPGSLLIDNSSGNTFGGGLVISNGTVQIGNNDANGSVGSGTVTANGTLVFDRSDNNTVTNVISGAGVLSQINTNILALAGASSGYSGTVTIQNGTLRINNNNALGAATAGAVTITNGGTLDVGGLSTKDVTIFGARQFIASGAGVGGNGAIVNNGTNTQINAFQQITLAANTTFGGTNRWDMRNGSPVLTQNGFTLTKTNLNEISFVSATLNGGGDIIINQGILSFEVAPVLNGSGTVYVNPAGALGQYKINAGAFARPIVLNGGAMQNMAASGGVGVNDSPITLTANSTLIGANIATNSITLNGSISESGGSFGLTKTGNSPYILTAGCTYSGSTIINQGMLALSGAGAIPNSRVITLQSNAMFDVSAVSGSWMLGASQTLNGSGVVNGVVTANGTVAPGTSGSAGTLTFSNQLTLAGTNVMKLNPTGNTNDQIVGVNDSIVFGGTLIVTNISGTPVNGQTFKLFTAPGYTAAFDTIILPSAPGLIWSNTLATDGTLTALVVSGPAPQPYITSISLSGTSLVLNGTNGSTASQTVLLTSTNLTLPLTSWTPLLTNTFGGGNFSITNTVAPNAPQNFYILRVP